MKKIIYFILLSLFFASIAHAETYAVKDGNGKLYIVDYFAGSQDTLDDVIRDSHIENPQSILKVNPGDLPATKEDREFWDVSGKKVVVDQQKKSEKDAEIAQKEQDQEALLEKLKITKEDLKLLNDIQK